MINGSKLKTAGEKRYRKDLPLLAEGITQMIDSFWTDGPDDYAKSLREHYEPRLKDLRHRRDDADDETARADLDAKIERIETEYKSKLASIDDSLF